MTDYLNKLPVLQDMAPKGGYGDFPYKRNLKGRGPSGLTLLLSTFAICSFGFAVVGMSNRQMRKQRLEMLESRIALYPLLLAENDRMTLKQLKDFEIAELEIMKNVPGWRAGESVYFTDKWILPADFPPI